MIARQIGDKGTFKVIGSAATSIGIGSSGIVDGRWVQEAGDGFWLQNAGGTVRVDIGANPTGVTQIFIDEERDGFEKLENEK